MPNNLSLRDYFAGQALMGLAATGGGWADTEISQRAYTWADTMLAERVKGIPIIETLDQAIEILNRYTFCNDNAWQAIPEGALGSFSSRPQHQPQYFLPSVAAIATAQKLLEDNYGR